MIAMTEASPQISADWTANRIAGVWPSEGGLVRQLSPYGGIYDCLVPVTTEYLMEGADSRLFAMEVNRRIFELNDIHRARQLRRNKRHDIGDAEQAIVTSLYLAAKPFRELLQCWSESLLVKQAFYSDDQRRTCRAYRNQKLLMRLVWLTADRRHRGLSDYCLLTQMEAMIVHYNVHVAVSDVRRWYPRVRQAMFAINWGNDRPNAILFSICAVLMERTDGARATLMGVNKLDNRQSVHSRRLDTIRLAVYARNYRESI